MSIIQLDGKEMTNEITAIHTKMSNIEFIEKKESKLSFAFNQIPINSVIYMTEFIAQLCCFELGNVIAKHLQNFAKILLRLFNSETMQSIQINLNR